MGPWLPGRLQGCLIAASLPLVLSTSCGLVQQAVAAERRRLEENVTRRNAIIFETDDGSYDYFIDDSGANPDLPKGSVKATQTPLIFESRTKSINFLYTLFPALDSEFDNLNYLRAREMIEAAQVFYSLVNSRHIPWRVGGEEALLALVGWDDMESQLVVANATAAALRTSYLKFMIAGYGSDMTRWAALQTRLEGGLLLAAGASRTSIFSDNKGYAFGLLPPGGTKKDSLFPAIVAMAEKVDATAAASGGENPCGATGCRASLIFGLIGLCDVADLKGGSATSPEGASGVFEEKMSSIDQEDLAAVLRRFQTKKVTVVKVCRLNLEALRTITATMEAIDFNPFAIITDNILSKQFTDAIFDGWAAGRGMLDVVAWHPSYPDRGEFSNLTSAEFIDLFKGSYRYEPSVYGVAQFAALCMLCRAMTLAGTDSVEPVREVLKTLELREFYAQVRFNEDGQSSQRYLVIQAHEKSNGHGIVYPFEKATQPWSFPRPTWAQVTCREATSVGGKECFAHGSCDRKGVCICMPPWIGEKCEDQLDEKKMGLATILAIVITSMAVLAIVTGILCFLLGRRRRRVAMHKALLAQALDVQDTTIVDKETANLMLCGWTRHGVQDFITQTKRKQSEERGVCVAYLLSDEFMELARERSGKEDPTFYDLKDKFFFGDDALGKDMICPRDGKPGVALVDWLPKKHRGQCTHFLSWTWGYKVTTVRDALAHWLEIYPQYQAEQVFIFMCFFVNNQHRILVSKEKTGAEELEHVFETNLTRIGKVIAVLDSWDSPRYLTRIWTIFEQVISIKLNVPVTMVLPRAASATLLAEFEMGKAGILRVKDSLTKVDSKSAKASEPEDERLVKDLIRKTVGFDYVDEKIIVFMINWVGAEMEAHMRTLVHTGKGESPHEDEKPAETRQDQLKVVVA